MRWLTTTPLILALAACGGELTQAERDAQDRALAEQVRDANEIAPPLDEVVPDAILYPDMETHDLLGLACSYAPGTSMGVRVIAREADAYMKIGGEMIRFAADPGSRELPAGTRTLYNSREYSLRLAIEDKGDAVQAPDGGAQLSEGTVWLRDRFDRVVYTGTGAVNCGA